jgi:hypothetical protein
MKSNKCIKKDMALLRREHEQFGEALHFLVFILTQLYTLQTLKPIDVTD